MDFCISILPFLRKTATWNICQFFTTVWGYNWFSSQHRLSVILIKSPITNEPKAHFPTYTTFPTNHDLLTEKTTTLPTTYDLLTEKSTTYPNNYDFLTEKTTTYRNNNDYSGKKSFRSLSAAMLITSQPTNHSACVTSTFH